jgi:uncharacterized protein (DUF58 family)
MPINRQKTEPFRNLELLAKKVVEGFITGLHKSPFHGFSVEFAEHRLYNTGESTRHIDWKLFARSERLFVKKYEEETNLRCQILLDVSASMQFPAGVEENKLRFAVHGAAALCELLKQQRDAYGLTLFGETMIRHLPAKGSPQHQQLIFGLLEEALADKTQHKGTATAAVINQIAGIIHQRSLVVIFSDMFGGTDDEALFAALRHLRYRKHEVVLFHVTDKKKELDFEFENRPYHFIDLETGEELKLNPLQVKESYRAALSSFREQLELRCGNYQIDYVEADISEGFDAVLYTYLVKRQRMIR